MTSFSTRSFEPEILDGPGFTTAELLINLREIDRVNRVLGGHNATLAGIKELVYEAKKKYTIVDFGCGSGDTLIYIARWLNRNNFSGNLYGIDINPQTSAYAKKNCKDFDNIKIITGNFNDYSILPSSIDIGISCLFCHHLNDSELHEYIKLLKNKCTTGFIINDLHRHLIAYNSIKFLANILNGSRMLRNDAPLSVKRGFIKDELVKAMHDCGVEEFDIRWVWAFRWLVVGRT